MENHLSKESSIAQINRKQSDSRSSKYPFLSDLSLSRDVTSNLSRNLDKIVSGSTEVYYSAIGSNNDPKDILKGWDKIFESNKSLINSNLLDLELSNRDKYGPRSISKPWKERRQSLLDYYSNDACKFVPRFRTKANSGRFRPLSIDKAYSLLKNNTNSGLPYYTKKARIKPDSLANFRAELDSKYPCVLFTRTQELGKTRNVWGYPISDTANEMRYFAAYLKYERTLPHRAAIVSPHATDLAITHIIYEARRLGLHLWSLDFSSFDASVKRTMQGYFFDEMKSLFQPQFGEDIEYIRNRFNTISILTPEGIMKGEHGISSGATFTNTLGTGAQNCMYADIINPDLKQLQGDDGGLAVTQDQMNILRRRMDDAGLVLNDSKSYLSKGSLVYLQKLFDFEYAKGNFIGGIYPTYRVVNRLVHLERFVDFNEYDLDGISYFSLRTISILENCKYHPLFTKLVDYIYSIDKYKLKFSQGAIVKYAQIQNKGQDFGDVIRNQHGDISTGIDKFETIRYLKERYNYIT